MKGAGTPNTARNHYTKTFWMLASPAERNQQMFTIQELFTIMLFLTVTGLYLHEARENEELRRNAAAMRKALRKLEA